MPCLHAFSLIATLIIFLLNQFIWQECCIIRLILVSMVVILSTLLKAKILQSSLKTAKGILILQMVQAFRSLNGKHLKLSEWRFWLSYPNDDSG